MVTAVSAAPTRASRSVPRTIVSRDRSAARRNRAASRGPAPKSLTVSAPPALSRSAASESRSAVASSWSWAMRRRTAPERAVRAYTSGARAAAARAIRQSRTSSATPAEASMTSDETAVRRVRAIRSWTPCTSPCSRETTAPERAPLKNAADWRWRCAKRSQRSRAVTSSASRVTSQRSPRAAQAASSPAASSAAPRARTRVRSPARTPLSVSSLARKAGSTAVPAFTMMSRPARAVRIRNGARKPRKDAYASSIMVRSP
ncbi:hypothetical protein ADK38_03820 [Streptomyces varsoviensis]|uniref:Uncharacterized protein n=1 Tax=Streptomyces varsoviensis TaxID=67373 RepID=A0ABR5JD31_9ACTN|nr:hypothetical protein ADK38_03820 [Streptomyces varsoviensis]